MMRGPEIDALAKQYPHLAELAIAIEVKAMKNGSGDTLDRGLGMNTPGRVPWGVWIKRPKQMGMFKQDEDEDNESMPCGCHD